MSRVFASEKQESFYLLLTEESLKFACCYFGSNSADRHKKKGVKLTPLVKFFGFVCVVFPFYRGLIHDRIIIQR